MKCTCPTQRLGFCVGETQMLCFASGKTQIIALSDTNMLVSQTQNSGVGGLSQRQGPTQLFCVAVEYRLMVYMIQCPKLSFYFVHSQGALPIKLCTRYLLHASSQYIAIINGSKNVHTPGAHLLKSCTQPWKCARLVQGAPLISDTVIINNMISFPCSVK